MSGRVIIQDTATRLYLGPDSSWVQSCQQAMVFEHTYLALLEGLRYQDKVLQVVWCFQNPAENLYISVRPEDAGRIRPCELCKLSAGLQPMSAAAAA